MLVARGGRLGRSGPGDDEKIVTVNPAALDPSNSRYRMLPRTLTIVGLASTLAIGLGAQGPPRPAQQPTRDTPAQSKDTPPAPGGRITGRVLTADNARPVKRARVFITAAELQGGRGILTDD